MAPDGTVTQVAGAGFNGNHHKSARAPELLVAGEAFPLDMEMHFTSWVFPKGHRIRVAVNNAQWPMLWPSPHLMTSTLAIGGDQGARVILPVIPLSSQPAPVFRPPQASPALAGFEDIETGTHRMEVDLPGRKLRWEAMLVFRSNLTGYDYEYERRVFENDKLLREKRWMQRFPRDP